MESIATTKIQFVGHRQVRVDTQPVSFPLESHELLLQTQYSLVSTGTELAKLNGAQQVAYPFDPGNRATGKVVALGSAVTDIEVGDTVFSYIPHWSHTRTNRLWVKKPEAVNEQHAPFVGMASVGMTALRVGEVELGDTVVVLGLGLVGNLAAQLCQLAGAHVVAGDLSSSRLALAQACGLSQTVDVSLPDVRSRVMEATGNQEPDVVVEASGTPEGAVMALELTGQSGEGNVVLLGSPRRSLSMDITPLLNRVHLWRGGTVNLKGAHEWRYPLHRDRFAKHSIERNIEVVFRMMAEQKLVIDPLISRVVPPAMAPTAFGDMLQSPDKYVGVLFDWN